MVSPWIAKNTVVNAPSPVQAPTPTSQWDATSIISTTNKIFGINENMTARDAWAATFLDLVDGSSPMRTDCPATLPPVAPLSPTTLQAEMRLPFNDHHYDSINLLCALAPRNTHPVCSGFDDEAAQSAFASSLGAAADEALLSWEPSATYPRLHAPAARHLQQQHFEGISRKLWAAYKAQVLGGSA